MPSRDGRRRGGDCAPATHDNKISAALRALLGTSAAYGHPTETSLIRAMAHEIASARAAKIPWPSIAESLSSVLRAHGMEEMSADTVRGVGGRVLKKAGLKPSPSRNCAEHIAETPSRPKPAEQAVAVPAPGRNSELDELLRGVEPRLRIQRE